MSAKVVLVTGAGTGFGALTVRALAKEGHIVYAGLYGKVEDQRKAAEAFAKDNNVDLRTVELNIRSEESVVAAVKKIYEETSRGDFTIVHNAGHMTYGPVEAHTPEQLLDLYDINTVGPHRLNRAALPLMRKAGGGHLIWISSSSVFGGGGPFLAPYFAAKAGFDSLATWYKVEVSLWGIDSTIISPGIFTSGTNHFSDSGRPHDQHITDEYYNGAYKGISEQAMEGPAKLIPADADPSAVADRVVEAVNAPIGNKPARLFADFVGDGCEEGSLLADKNHNAFMTRAGLEQVLTTKLQK